jgi:serine/threonine-protein kinase
VFPQVFGKYVLDRELASGGMARVYLATLRGAVGFEKRLVVKQIRPELASDPAFVRRFVDEAKTAVELSHPNIVPVYELGVEQGVYYIAMEFCAGATLAEILSETGAVSPEEGAYLGVEICRALDYAHRRAGIVHRDVTPRNVLVDEEGAVRLIDFGIAAPVTEHGPREVFGSPGHMPPEQLAGKQLTAATDVFAVATLLFEAWTRRPPFRRATARASADALDEPVPALDELAPELAPVAELISRGLSLDASARPAQAEMFARPLRDFLKNADTGDVARRLGERVRKVLERAERKAKRALGEIAATPAAISELTPAGESSRSAEASASAPTYTFAARGEVAEWTRRIDDHGSEASQGPATRKLASIPPEAPASIDPGLEGVELSGEESSVSRVRDGSSGDSARGTSRKSQQGAWRFTGLVLSGAVIAAAVFVVALKARPSVEPMRSQRQTASLATAIALSAPATIAAASASAETAQQPAVSADPPSPPAHDAKPMPLPSASVVHRARLSEEAPAPTPSGTIRLTADPPASVTLLGPSGLRALTTPVRSLALPPGVYVVTFRNDTYGMPVVARVNVDADHERSVHVDFREVEPRVTVR